MRVFALLAALLFGATAQAEPYTGNNLYDGLQAADSKIPLPPEAAILHKLGWRKGTY